MILLHSPVRGGDNRNVYAEWRFSDRNLCEISSTDADLYKPEVAECILITCKTSTWVTVLVTSNIKLINDMHAQKFIFQKEFRFPHSNIFRFQVTLTKSSGLQAPLAVTLKTPALRTHAHTHTFVFCNVLTINTVRLSIKHSHNGLDNWQGPCFLWGSMQRLCTFVTEVNGLVQRDN